MKNKIIKLSIFLLIATLIITGCKIQSVEEFNDENTSETKEVKNETDISKDKVEVDLTKEKDEKVKDDQDTNKDDEKSEERKKDKEVETDKVEEKARVDKHKPGPKQHMDHKTKHKTSHNKDKTSTHKTHTKHTKQTSKDKLAEKPKPKPKPKQSYVTLEIRVDEILKNYDKLDPKLQSTKFVPSNGVILRRSSFELKDGETAFDILVKATRQNRIHMEYQGSNKNQYGSAYIKGINNIYEFSCGELSGWRYKVNGSYPSVGVSAYKLKNGDHISFNYTCNLGRN